MDRNKGSQKGLAPVIIVVAIVVVLVVGVGAYLVTKSNKNSGKTTSQSASKTPAKPNEVLSQAKSPVSGGNFAISELGVSFPLPDALKGMQYIVSTPPGGAAGAPKIIKLELDQYTQLADKCVGAPASNQMSFASLVKATGQYDPSQKPPSTVLKQFDKFYIANLGGQLPPGQKCQDSSTQNQFDALTKSLNDALTSAFQSATQS